MEHILKPGNIKLKLPMDWSIKRLGDILMRLENGLSYKQNEHILNDKAFPITRIETISDGSINPDRIGWVENISEHNLSSSFKLNRGDILFSHINSLEHVGKTAIYLGFPKLLIH